MIDEVEFLGMRFASLEPDETIAWVMREVDSAHFAYVVTPNVDHVVHCRQDADLQSAYDSADLRLCDSTIIDLLARFSGIDLSVVKGSDLTAMLLATAMPAGLRICLIGGTTHEATWLERHTGVSVMQFSPPMGVRHDLQAQDAVADFVERSGCGLVLLAIGAPQSEMIAASIKRRGKAGGVALCIGASLEFLTGAKRRAPAWMQTARLEWAFRLLSEPGRLWRRYLVNCPRIFPIWLRWRRDRRNLANRSPAA